MQVHFFMMVFKVKEADPAVFFTAWPASFILCQISPSLILRAHCGLVGSSAPYWNYRNSHYRYSN